MGIVVLEYIRSNVRRIHKNMERVLSRWDGEDCIFVDPVLYHLEDFHVLVSPMKGSKISNEIIEKFAVYVKIFDVTAVESKASQLFHNISYTLG